MRPARFLREKVTLRDGRTVVVRPIDRDDASALIDFHNHLSPESQYYRFFGPKPRLTPSEAEYLANVDFHKRFALVGEAPTQDGKQLVGVGRFDVNEPGVAEAAIVIRDDYQHVGLGTEVLQRMREVARGRGLDAFYAEILPDNTKMLELLAANGMEVSELQGGVYRITAPVHTPVLLRGLKVVARTAESLLDKRDGNTAATQG